MKTVARRLARRVRQALPLLPTAYCLHQHQARERGGVAGTDAEQMIRFGLQRDPFQVFLPGWFRGAEHLPDAKAQADLISLCKLPAFEKRRGDGDVSRIAL